MNGSGIRMRRILIGAMVLALGVMGSVGEACQIPVFRYALERWVPDPYQVLVFHQGALTKEQQGLVGRLEAAAGDAKDPVNIQVHVVDMEKPGAEYEKAVAAVKSKGVEKFPYVEIRYPVGTQTSGKAWTGELTKETVTGIIDSPVRREIVKRLLGGQSAVWVFLPYGNKEEDDKAEAELKRSLEKLAGELKLPTLEDLRKEEEFIENSKIDLKIKFSVIKVDRKNKLEAFFVSSLLNAEDGIAEEKKPVAIPVYGRGRCHFALAGGGITYEVIGEMCQFLVGPCSCTVKRENPGADLVFAVNWNEKVVGSATEPHVLPDILPALPDVNVVDQGNKADQGNVKLAVAGKQKSGGDNGSGAKDGGAGSVAEGEGLGVGTVASSISLTWISIFAVVVVAVAVVVFGVTRMKGQAEH